MNCLVSLTNDPNDSENFSYNEANYDDLIAQRLDGPLSCLNKKTIIKPPSFKTNF